MERITINVNGVSIVMIPVEGGTFMMGATVEQRSEAWDNEKPIRNVTLSPYYLGETVVTQALWNAVTQEDVETGGNLPVTGKNWNEWQTFIRKLNEMTGKKFRMPTEAEWENAARGGNRSRGCKFAGSNNLNDVAWYDANSGSCVHPVMQKQPNELGLYDMTGNVFEWCYDKYGAYGEDPEIDPIGSMSGTLRVYRGGAFSYYQRGCRLSCRFCIEPTGRDYGKIGLRLAMSEGAIDPYDSSGASHSGFSTKPNPNKGVYDGNDRSTKTDPKPSKPSKTTTQTYYPPIDDGGKKKKWPIFVGIGGVAVLLIAVLAVVIGGRVLKDLKETEIKPNPTVTEQTETPKTNPEQEMEQKRKDNIFALCNTAGQLFAENRLDIEGRKYQNYDPMVGELSKGWNNLLEAEAESKKLTDSTAIVSNYGNISEMKEEYLNHIAGIYQLEYDNLKGLKKKSSSSTKPFIEQGEARIHQLDQFSGIAEVKKRLKLD